MNNKFDELAKGMAQSVTRRQALRKFGVGLAGMALACLGLANRADAGHGTSGNGKGSSAGPGYLCCQPLPGVGGVGITCVPKSQGCPSGTSGTLVGNCKKCV